MDGFQRRFNETEMDHGITPAALKDLSSRVSVILFYVSIVCAVAVIVGYAFIRHVNKDLDRISLRLLLYASVVHILLAVATILRSHLTLSDPACQFLMFLYVFSDIGSTLLITCIAVNLQIVFVHSIRSCRHLEFVYLTVSALISFIAAVAPLISPTPVYGYDPNVRECWFLGDQHHITSLWVLFDLYLWILLSIVYCFIALLLVLIKMRREENLINQHLDRIRPRKPRFFNLFFRPTMDISTDLNATENDDPASPDSPRRRSQSTDSRNAFRPSFLAKTIYRVIWYPLALVITRIWGVIDFIYSYQNQKVCAFYALMTFITVPAQGIFLMLFFLADPALQKAMQMHWDKRNHGDHLYCVRPSKGPPGRSIRPTLLDVRLASEITGISVPSSVIHAPSAPPSVTIEQGISGAPVTPTTRTASSSLQPPSRCHSLKIKRSTMQL
ncbi:uncharacterized protein BYT42DRAFT_601593 [Radiomyces spectabilis]|uniref:uncharacterized protein n=1 Tax=Radiomyces spectabilis TaxID=64574 RepID=UPI00221F8C46|nr:uncharacterized protein BYT42DRAFT_601593 [Radiomyces spectabilis]KAI8394069.1 hypothetical protein BYT42DRAFT_601593 [Radiomyces spectabilis]